MFTPFHGSARTSAQIKIQSLTRKHKVDFLTKPDQTRFQEIGYRNGPLDPVFAKNHESGVIFDGFCDHFRSNPAKCVKSRLTWVSERFLSRFQVKTQSAVKSKLVQ